MIIFSIVLIFIVIAFFEFMIYQKRLSYKLSVVQIQNSNGLVEKLQSLSYILSSKNDVLEKDFDELSNIIFKQAQFALTELFIFEKLSEKPVIIRRPLKSDYIDTSFIIMEKSLLNITKEKKKLWVADNLKNAYLTSLDYAILIPLYQYGNLIGCLMLFSEKDLHLSEQEIDFLGTAGNITTMLISKFDFAKLLGNTQQFEAVNIPW